MLIIICAILLCAFLSGFATIRYYSSMKASRELSMQGIDALRQLLEIIKLAQQHRALHIGTLNGQSGFSQKMQLVEATLHQRFVKLEQFQDTVKMPYDLGLKSLKVKWEQLLSSSYSTGEQSFRAHSSFIARALDGLWEIADKFSLTTNQDIEVRDLSNQMVKTFPELAESLAQVRGLSVQVASKHEISADKKLQLMYTLSRIEDRISALNNHFPTSSIQQLMAFIEIIRKGTETSSLHDQDPDFLFKESTQVIDQLYECILKGFNQLNTKIAD